MGLMQIQQPEVTLPKMVERLKAEPDASVRKDLFNALLALLNNEECLAMLEKLVDPDEFLLDTPFLRQICKQSKVEDILEAVFIRLNPPVQVYSDIEKKLAMVNDTEALQQIFTAALTADTIEKFTNVLDHALGQI